MRSSWGAFGGSAVLFAAGVVALTSTGCIYAYNADPTAFKSEIVVKNIDLVEAKDRVQWYIRVSIQSADRYETYYDTKEYNIYPKVYPCSKRDQEIGVGYLFKQGMYLEGLDPKKLDPTQDPSLYEFSIPVSSVWNENDKYRDPTEAIYDLRKEPLDICFTVRGASPIWGVSSSKEVVLHKDDLAAAIQRGKVGDLREEK